MNAIVSSKLNISDMSNIHIETQEGDNMYNLCIKDIYNKILFYQTYKCVNEYCGDCVFKIIPNEFGDGKLFSNAELKILFELLYDDVVSYNLDNLYVI